MFVLVATAATTTTRAMVYDETIDGDISGDRLVPTNRQLDLGSNLLTATSVRDDREYIHFHLGGGLRLEQLILTAYAGNDQLAFIAVQAGSVFTEPHQGTDPANLLGYSHFGPGNGTVGTDILDDMGQGAGSMGFVPPLTGPDYTFWIQQTGTNAVTYTFDFVVTPEPATMIGLAAGVAALARRRRR